MLKYSDLQKRWGVSRRAIERWCNRPGNKLSKVHLSARCVRFRLSDVEQFERRAGLYNPNLRLKKEAA